MQRFAIASVACALALTFPACNEGDKSTSGERPPTPTAVPGNPPFVDIPSPWTDPAGDVTLPNADMVAGTIVVGDGTVELRIRFVAPPFPSTATHFIDWCIDLDQSAVTGSQCGSGDLVGADAGVSLQSIPGQPLELTVFRGGLSEILDPDQHVTVDPATNTVRVCFSASLLGDNNHFHYAVVSIFGGSSGANDRAPNSPFFGNPANAFVNQVGNPTPCCPSSSETLCQQVGALVDEDCPCAGPWRNHGEYVSCVAHAATRELANLDDCLNDGDREGVHGCVVSARARSDCGK